MARPKIYHEETIAINIRFPASLHKKLKERAKDNRRSLSQEVLWLLQRALEILEKEPDALNEE